MQARMPNPATVVTEAMQPIQAMWGAAMKAGVPAKTLGLVHMRASQINGCSYCVDAAARGGSKSGETNERLFAVGAWRHAPYFTDAERAALALTEAVTRLDPTNPVPDAVWNDAKKHYDERVLAGLLIAIATVNVWNRLNISTGQVAGTYKP